jgi:hypothetical protein
MGNAIPQWSIDVANRLLATYVSPDRRLLDMEGFKAALIRALIKAHEEAGGALADTVSENPKEDAHPAPPVP